MFTFIVFPRFDLVKFDHIPSKKKNNSLYPSKVSILLFEVGAYHNLMFVSGFILPRHIRFVVTGSHRRVCKFDFQQETKSYFTKL